MMLVTVHDRTPPRVTRVCEQLLYCDVEGKWKNYHITFLGYYLSKIREKCETLLLETKNNPEVNYYPIRISRGGGGCCRRNITR
jgi:hypothetical protein